MTAQQTSAEFHLLGPVEVRVGGEPVTIGSARERALLAALLLRANRLVTVDELVATVWSEQPPDDPRATVQTVVMRLRKKLPDGIIHTRPGGYLITPPYLDLEAFHGHVAAAAEAARDRDVEREAVELRAGLALWRGPALSNITAETLHRDVVPSLWPCSGGSRRTSSLAGPAALSPSCARSSWSIRCGSGCGHC